MATIHKPKPKSPAKALNHPELPWARHVVCFWKQNDLGLFGRRPDRWIEYWRQHPLVEKVLVFEMPQSQKQLQEMLCLATTLDKVSASEYQLLLQQATRKLLGQCDDSKVQYCTYTATQGQASAGQHYLRWVLEQCQQAKIKQPLAVLWPACFVNPTLLQHIAPSHLLVDLVDDQRLFPGNEAQHSTITEQYKTFIGLAQQVVSNSPGLIKSFNKEFNCVIDHLPNNLLPMLPKGTTCPHNQFHVSITKHPKRPVVGYVGNLRGRIDRDTLLQVMHQHPEWDFWFVGQTHRSKFFTTAKVLPNARFFGTMTYQQAQALMEQFDLGIVPFTNDALVKSMSPIKLDDYARSNLPTVVLDPKNKKGFEASLLKTLKIAPKKI